MKRSSSLTAESLSFTSRSRSLATKSASSLVSASRSLSSPCVCLDCSSSASSRSRSYSLKWRCICASALLLWAVLRSSDIDKTLLSSWLFSSSASSTLPVKLSTSCCMAECSSKSLDLSPSTASILVDISASFAASLSSKLPTCSFKEVTSSLRAELAVSDLASSCASSAALSCTRSRSSRSAVFWSTTAAIDPLSSFTLSLPLDTSISRSVMLSTAV
mmetsp:Transcript_121841/g.356083  ORF Transcript_121841/g.356083 Transcript_121841/m.356083 type:complete len:218 (+) Transcript_121841:332-985(+)